MLDLRVAPSHVLQVVPTSAFMRFMNDPEVQEMLHVRGTNLPGINFVPEDRRALSAAGDEGRSRHDTSSLVADGYFVPPAWETCSDTVNDSFQDDRKTESVTALQYLAKHIRVLLYSGEFDINTNLLGTLKVLQKNEWVGQNFNTAKRGLWKFNGDGAGEYYSIGDSFAFLVVRKTGHLLPGDLPDVALDLFNRFLEGRSFHDVVLPSAKDYLPGGKAAMKTVNAWAASRAAAGTAPSSGLLTVALLLAAAAAGGVVLMVRRYKAARQAAVFGTGTGSGGDDTVEVMFDGAHPAATATTPAVFSFTATPSQPPAASYAYGSGTASTTASASAPAAAHGKQRKPWGAKAMFIAQGYQPIDDRSAH